MNTITRALLRLPPGHYLALGVDEDGMCASVVRREDQRPVYTIEGGADGKGFAFRIAAMIEEFSRQTKAGQ